MQTTEISTENADKTVSQRELNCRDRKKGTLNAIKGKERLMSVQQVNASNHRRR
jgi:hypothetical protein